MPGETVCVDSSQMQLSRRQKQELLDRELKSLVEECRNKAHMDDKTLERAARPLFDLKSQRNSNVRLWRLWKVFVVLTVISGILAFDTTYRFLCIFGRLSSEKILPYWDFTLLYEENCLVSNPYYLSSDSSSVLDCKVCDDVNVDGIEKIRSADPDDIAEVYLKAGRPVIVKDGMTDWPCMMPQSRLDGRGIRELYSSDKALNTSAPCSLTASFSGADLNISRVFDRMVRGEQVLAAWENCDPNAAKRLRSEYRRLYFLPGMAESSSMNWVIVAINGTKDLWHATPYFSGQAVWIAVVEGEYEVTVKPRSICSSACNPIAVSLGAGDILLFTREMWYVTISHHIKDETVAIASSVYWDVV